MIGWCEAFATRGLDPQVSAALTVRFNRLAREGKSLYILTLMFGYVPGLSKGIEFCGLEQRIEILWHGILGRLFNCPRRSESFAAAFFDQGTENGANLGLHCHVVLAVDEARFKQRFQAGFREFWQQEESRWINRPFKGRFNVKDPIVRSHLTKYDGSEQALCYCGKSTGTGGIVGLGECTVLYLGCDR